MQAFNCLARSHLQVAVGYVKFFWYVHSSGAVRLNDDLAGHCKVVDISEVVSSRGRDCPVRNSLRLAAAHLALARSFSACDLGFTNSGNQLDTIFRETGILGPECSKTNSFRFCPLTGFANGSAPFCEVPSHVG